MGCTAMEEEKETEYNAAAFAEIFKKFDADGNGKLDKKELAAFLRESFSDAFSEEDAATVQQALDLDGSGTVSEAEFRAFLRSYDRKSQTIKKTSALVIVDVQNDFITGSLANPYKAADIVPTINAIRDKFDVVVISYDWHPQDHCSFVESANDGKVAIVDAKESYNAFEQVTLAKDEEREEHKQVLYPRHAVQDTDGGATHADLKVEETDFKVYKGTKPNIDSYSAFFDNLKANDCGLLKILEDAKVTDVYCCGLVFDICVMSTALHGAELGFKTVVIEDACRPLAEDNVAPTKEKLAKAGVEVMQAEEVVLALGTSLDEHYSLKEYVEMVKSHASAAAVHTDLERIPSSHAIAANEPEESAAE